MLAVVLGISLCLLTAVVVIAGDTAIKVAADGDLPLTSSIMIAGYALYGISAVMWYFAMRHIGLAQAGVIYSMFTLLALCAIGAIVFDETLAARELLGIVCALAAVGLMARIA